MISKIAGILSTKNTKAKLAKLAIALVLSNIFFFLLFSGSETKPSPVLVPEGWVEVQLRAELLTPFQNGKKVLLVQRNERLKLQGMLKEATDQEGKLTVLVKENEASRLFLFQEWEIVPFIADLKFPVLSKGEMHEIRY